MKPGISGYTIVRNALSLDYAIVPCIESLLAGCDEVVVGEAASTDGTKEMLHEWASREPRLRIVDQEWRDPVGEAQWFVRWINETRQHLRYTHQLALDADEVFDERGYVPLWILQNQSGSVQMHRLNYWSDPYHLTPHGRCCSHLVVRFGPSDLHMTSDEIYGTQDFPGSEPEIRRRAIPMLDQCVIHHLGFLRRREALFAKCKVVLRAFFNGYDERLVDAEAKPQEEWSKRADWFDLPLLDYGGPWPERVKKWMRERGYRI